MGVVFRLFCEKFLFSGSDLIFGRCDLRLCRIQLCLCAGKLCFAVRQLLFRVLQLFLVLVNLLLGIADLAVQFRLVVLNLLFSILDLRFGIVQFGLGVIQFRFRLGDLLSAVVNLFLILRPNGIKPLCRGIFQQGFQLVFVRLYFVGVRIGIGVQSLGVPEGDSCDHVVIAVESILCHHRIAVQFAGTGGGLPLVDAGENFRGVDKSGNGKGLVFQYHIPGGVCLFLECDLVADLVIVLVGVGKCNFVCLFGESAADDFILGDVLIQGENAAAFRGVFQHHIFQVAVGDLFCSVQAVDGFCVFLVNAHAADDGQVCGVVLLEIVAGGFSHIRSGDL